MDNREYLNIPKNFAYIMRTGGTNLYQFEFQISYTIGVGGIKYIALTGHSNCGMSNLESKKEQFISGMVSNAGWTREKAENHFEDLSPKFEIGNEIDYTLEEVKHLRIKYPKIIVAPLFYKLEDNLLYLIEE
jgi:carbonic anhydrase